MTWNSHYFLEKMKFLSKLIYLVLVDHFDLVKPIKNNKNVKKKKQGMTIFTSLPLK